MTMGLPEEALSLLRLIAHGNAVREGPLGQGRTLFVAGPDGVHAAIPEM